MYQASRDDKDENDEQDGEPWSWEAIPPDSAHFTPDISPFILAAHTDNYEIIKVETHLILLIILIKMFFFHKILLDHGAILPSPHHLK